MSDIKLTQYFRFGVVDFGLYGEQLDTADLEDFLPSHRVNGHTAPTAVVRELDRAARLESSLDLRGEKPREIGEVADVRGVEKSAATRVDDAVVLALRAFGAAVARSQLVVDRARQDLQQSRIVLVRADVRRTAQRLAGIRCAQLGADQMVSSALRFG